MAAALAVLDGAAVAAAAAAAAAVAVAVAAASWSGGVVRLENRT